MSAQRLSGRHRRHLGRSAAAALLVCAGGLALVAPLASAAPAGRAAPRVAAPTLRLNPSVATAGTRIKVAVKVPAGVARCRLSVGPASGGPATSYRGKRVGADRRVSWSVATAGWALGRWSTLATCGARQVRGAFRLVTSPGPVPQSPLPFTEPSITASPKLNLAYRSTIGDFAVRCVAGSPVTVSVSAAKGTWVSVDSRKWTTGTFTRSVALAEGQSFALWSGGGGKTYRSTVRCLPSDFPAFQTSGTGTAQWYAFDEAMGTGTHYAFVTDAHGTPVWWFRAAVAKPYAVQYWNAARLAELGSTRKYAFSYEWAQIVYVVGLDGGTIKTLGNGLDLDGHDLEWAGNGTYWGLRNVRRDCPATPSECVDMTTYGGTTQDTLIDAQILKFDAAGNELWTWNTRGHIPVADSARLLNLGIASAHLADGSWDLVHANSVEPDGAGGLILSGRNLDAVYRIDIATGDITWKLGGTHSPQSLTVVGDPMGGSLTLAAQHDARLLPDGTLTVYDDGTGVAGRLARAVRYAIHPRAGTATVLESVRDPNMTSQSFCCGSARRLPNGHWVVAWGGSQRISEVKADGSPVLTILAPKGISPYRVVPIPAGRLPAQSLRDGMDAQYPR